MWFISILLLPIIASSPVGQGKLNFEASPSGLEKPNLEIKELVKPASKIKVEGYVENQLEHNLTVGEKILPSEAIPKLEILKLIPAALDEAGETIEIKRGASKSQMPRKVEITIDGPSSAISVDAEPENATQTNITETENVIDFLNANNFTSPEPLSLEIRDLPPSRHELSPEFSLNEMGGLVARTGNYMTEIKIPVSVQVGLDESGAGSYAVLKATEKGALILPHQAIELVKLRNRLVKNITGTELAGTSNNAVAYKIKSLEKLKVLGLFTVNKEIETVIDANTGETLSQPWYSKLPLMIIKSVSDH